MARLGAVYDAPQVRADLVGATLVDRVAGEALLLEQGLARLDIGAGELRADRRNVDGGRRGGRLCRRIVGDR